MMTYHLRRLLSCTRGVAAVETALVFPIYLGLTLVTADLGMGMYQRMAVTNAAQAGAHYAAINYCTTMSATCVSAIQAAMDAASGLSGTGTECPPTISTPVSPCPTPCPVLASPAFVVTVTATKVFTPVLVTGWVFPPKLASSL